MKDLGDLNYFLGIEVLCSKTWILISQRKYILVLLVKIGLLDCKPSETPIMLNYVFKIVEGAEPADRAQYQHLAGNLIYLFHTRPDIAFSISVLSQFMHEPQVSHMEGALRVPWYLKGFLGVGILAQKNGILDIEAYTDAHRVSNSTDKRSTSGYFALVGENYVPWNSKKQKVLAFSSAEAKFRGISCGLAEVLQLQKLLGKVGFPVKEPWWLMYDNRDAISISENLVQHDRAEHVEVNRTFIKE